MGRRSASSQTAASVHEVAARLVPQLTALRAIFRARTVPRWTAPADRSSRSRTGTRRGGRAHTVTAIPWGGAGLTARTGFSGVRPGTDHHACGRPSARTASSTRPLCASRTASAGVFRVDDTRRTMNPVRGHEPRRRPLADRPAADGHPRRGRRSRRSRRGSSTHGRPAGDLAGGSVLRHLVQRLPRADDRHRLHARLRELPPARERFPPSTRNGVLFPRRTRPHAILSRRATGTRLSATSSTPSPDLVHRGRHRHVLAPVPWSWQATKVGAGPTPIEIDEGWLVIYHGVLASCNGFVYSLGAALLDLDEPWRPSQAAAAATCSRPRPLTSGLVTSECGLPWCGARRRQQAHHLLRRRRHRRPSRGYSTMLEHVRHGEESRRSDPATAWQLPTRLQDACFGEVSIHPRALSPF